MIEDDLIIGTCHVSSFFAKESNVQIPDYQRPYVWGKKKIDQLITDLEEHFLDEDYKFKKNLTDYYLGTILLHHGSKSTGESFNIIDGQQRITTLLLMDHAWNGEGSILSDGFWNLSYKSLVSHNTIQENFEYLVSKGEYLDSKGGSVKNQLKTIFNHLAITCIITSSEDQAFTFFDSQNNRGVPLSAIDFLKSYHLRELKDLESLQAVFAKKWDFNNKGKFLDLLFNTVLWRNRNWKGKSLQYENKDLILESFQTSCIKKTKNDVISLYPNAFNKLSDNLTFDVQRGVNVQPSSLWLQTKEIDYPFSIRQPIQKGIGFFLYTEKYAAIYGYLFEEGKNKDVNEFYGSIYRHINGYLKSFFKLCVVSYFDKFKEDRILEFCMWLDYTLGTYRMNQKSIVANTIIKILRDNDQNLLDVIDMAYEPSELFDFLKTNIHVNGYVLTEEVDSGVRYSYYESNCKYYGIPVSDKEPKPKIKDKIKWINARIING